MKYGKIIEVFEPSSTDVYEEVTIRDILDRPVRKVLLNMTVLCGVMKRHGDATALWAVDTYEAVKYGTVLCDGSPLDDKATADTFEAWWIVVEKMTAAELALAMHAPVQHVPPRPGSIGAAMGEDWF